MTLISCNPCNPANHRRRGQLFYFAEPVASLVAFKASASYSRLFSVLTSIQAVQTKCDCLLVEGPAASSFPLGKDYTVLDLVTKLGLPCHHCRAQSTRHPQPHRPYRPSPSGAELSSPSPLSSCPFRAPTRPVQPTSVPKGTAARRFHSRHPFLWPARVHARRGESFPSEKCENPR